MFSKIDFLCGALPEKSKQVFWLFLGLFSMGLPSCRVGEKAPEPKPYIFASLSEQCREVNYRTLFIDYFNQPLVPAPASLTSFPEKELNDAMACTQNALKSIVSEVRGEEPDSLSKEELKALLGSTDFQKLLEDMNIKNLESKMKKLTEEENFNLFMEIKNFTVEMIRYFLEGQPLEKACTSKSDRLYEWEMEMFIPFLDKFRLWLKEVDTIAESIHTHLIENVPAADQTLDTPSPSDPTPPNQSEALRKSFFSDPEARTTYLLPALSEGFSERAPALADYLQEISYLLNSPLPSVNIRGYSHPALEATKRKKLSEAFFILMENNPLNESPQLQKSDIQLLVIIWDIAHLLLQIYDTDQDGMISKQEFQDNISCLEKFLLTLRFKNNQSYLHYFIEYQARPDETWLQQGHFLWNQWTGDDNFFLSQSDLFHLTFKIVSKLPWHLLRRPPEEPNTEKLQQILKELKQN